MTTAVLAVGVEIYPWKTRSVRGVARQALDVARWADSAGVLPAHIVLATSWEVEGDNPENLPYQRYTTTADDIRLALEYLVTLDIDAVLVYWCGHGLTSTRSEVGGRCVYLSDACRGLPEVPQYLALEEVERFLSHRFAGKLDQIRIVDACSTWEEELQEAQIAPLFGMQPPPTRAASYQLSSAPVGDYSQFDPASGRSHFTTLVLTWLESHSSLPFDVNELANHVADGIDAKIATGCSTCRVPWVDYSGSARAIVLRGQARYDARERQRTDLEGVFSAAIGTFLERRTALQAITSWLSGSDQQGPPLFVTGGSGCGKTALLGVVANLALTGRARTVDHAGWAEDGIPPEGSLDGAIDATDLQTREILAGIALAAKLPDEAITTIAGGQKIDDAVGAIKAHLRTATQPAVVLIDAVDRAVDSQILKDKVLRPLMESGLVRLLIGVVDSSGLADDGDLRIDLDGEFLDRDKMVRRVALRLRELQRGERSAWDLVDVEVLGKAADEIATISGPSFLLAELIAGQVARTPPPAQVDEAWINSLPTTIREVMVEAITSDSADPATAQRAFDLLLPLAYARGDGMTWSVWCAVAGALFPGRRFDEQRDAGLRDELAMFTRSGSADRSDPTYRLAHPAFEAAVADDSLEPRDKARDEGRIVDWLRSQAQNHASGEVDWQPASSYAKAHIIDHARKAGRADELLTDVGLVLQAQPAQLLAAFDESSDDRVRQIAGVYRNALRWLRQQPSIGTRAAQFSLAARQTRTTLLDDAHAADLGARWTATWASWRLQSPHRRLVYGKHQVRAVAIGVCGDRPLLLAGGADNHVRAWDFDTGQVEGKDRRGETTCLATTDGLAFSGSEEEAVVRRWHLSENDVDLPPYEGHEASVRALATAPLGNRSVVASGDAAGAVHLWYAEEMTVLKKTPATGGSAVTAIAMTADLKGRLVVVVAREDGSVALLEGLVWRQLQLAGHASGRVVHALAVEALTEGGIALLTGCADQRVRAFRLDEAGGCERLWTGRHADAVHAVAVAKIDGVPVAVSGSDDGTVRVWDLANGHPVGAPYTAHGGWVRAIAWHQDAEGTKVVSGGADGAVHVWDLPRSGPVRGPFAGHARSVRALALQGRDTDRLLLSGSTDGTIRTWEPIGGTDRSPAQAAVPAGRHGSIGALVAVDVGGVSHVVAAGQSGVQVFREGNAPVTLPQHRGWIGSLAEVALPAGPGIAAAGTDGVPRVWDLLGLREHTPYAKGDGTAWHQHPVHALAAVGSEVVSAGGDPEIHVWDGTTGAGIARLPLPEGSGCVRALAVCRQLVISAGDDGWIRIHDLRTKGLVAEKQAASGIHALVVFDREGDGPRLISAGADGNLRTWDLTVPADADPGHVEIVEGLEAPAHRGRVRSLLAGTHNGQLVAYSGGDDGRIGVWDLSLNRVIGGGHEGWVRAVAITRDKDRTWIAVSGGDDATIRTWDLATGEARLSAPVASRGSIRSMIAGRRGQSPVVVLGSTDNAVRILDISADSLTPLVGHTDWVCAVELATSDGVDVVVSGSDDGTVRLWDLATGRPIRTLPTDGVESVRALAVAGDDGSLLVLGSRDHQVHLAPLDRDGGAAKSVAELTDSVQSVSTAVIDGTWILFARDDSGRLIAWPLTDGPEVPAPPSGAGEVGAVATARRIGPPRVAVASGEVVTVSEWDGDRWRVLALPDLGSDVLDLDFDESGDLLLVGARRGVALINLAPNPFGDQSQT